MHVVMLCLTAIPLVSKAASSDMDTGHINSNHIVGFFKGVITASRPRLLAQTVSLILQCMYIHL